MKKVLLMLLFLIFLSSCSGKSDVKNTIIDSAPLIPESLEELPEHDHLEEFTEHDYLEDLTEQYQEINIDLTEYFKETKGTAVFYTPEIGMYLFNEEKADTYDSPYSTFKIMSTLIGLSEEIVTSSDSKMNYNGTAYWNENWNHDLTLKESFQSSCVWYYHQILYSLSHSVVETHLKEVGYGNCDLSQWNGNESNSVPELNGFWLNSSLKIIPRQQVIFLETIFEKETIYTENQLFLLKDFMKTDVPNVYGKTGSGNQQNWYVGFYLNESDTTYFAILVESDEKLIQTPKEIALSIIKDWDSNFPSI
ncbi:MAG: penicillin-binding transpeptidase domain-containing protein [Eubacteriales bacterium]